MTWLSTITGLAKAALPSATTDGLAKRIIVDLYGRLIPADFTFDTQSSRKEEVNPAYTWHVEDVLADGISDSATDLFIDMDGYRLQSTEMIVNSGTPTLTVHATLLDDGTAPADIAAAAWIDVTEEWYDDESYSVSKLLERDVFVTVKYIWLELAAGTWNVDILSKRGW